MQNRGKLNFVKKTLDMPFGLDYTVREPGKRPEETENHYRTEVVFLYVSFIPGYLPMCSFNESECDKRSDPQGDGAEVPSGSIEEQRNICRLAGCAD